MPVCGKHVIKKSLVYPSPIQKTPALRVTRSRQSTHSLFCIAVSRHLNLFHYTWSAQNEKCLEQVQTKRTSVCRARIWYKKLGNAPKFNHGFLCFYNIRSLVAPKEACGAKCFSTSKYAEWFCLRSDAFTNHNIGLRGCLAALAPRKFGHFFVQNTSVDCVLCYIYSCSVCVLDSPLTAKLMLLCGVTVDEMTKNHCFQEMVKWHFAEGTSPFFGHCRLVTNFMALAAQKVLYFTGNPLVTAQRHRAAGVQETATFFVPRLFRKGVQPSQRKNNYTTKTPKDPMKIMKF